MNSIYLLYTCIIYSLFIYYLLLFIYNSAAHGDNVVPSHRTDWGLRSFAVAGPSSRNALPAGSRSSSFG